VLVQSQTNPVDSFRVSFTNNICGDEGVACSRSLTIDVGSGKSQESIVLPKGVTANSKKYFFLNLL